MTGANLSELAGSPEETILQARALRDLLIQISVELCPAGPDAEREITVRLNEAVHANQALLASLSTRPNEVSGPLCEMILDVRREWARTSSLLKHRTDYYLGRLQRFASRCSGYNARGQYSVASGASFSLRG
jgi:hypothetical protein